MRRQKHVRLLVDFINSDYYWAYDEMIYRLSPLLQTPQIDPRLIERLDFRPYLTINKGSRDGIKVNMNVIADGGLVGIVSSVGDSYAVVRSIIDDTSNVSATISSTQDNCIVSGSLEDMTASNLIRYSNLADSDDKVAIGDVVITSNISDKYLPGLLIGYVSSVDLDENDLSKSGTITPVVDFKHLSDVLIIKQLKESYTSE